MPRLFASMMRFSIWSHMPRPCRPPIALASPNSATASANCWPFSATGTPASKRTETFSGFTVTSSRQKATPMIGLTMAIPLSRNSRSFASCVAPRMFESVEYAFSALILYSKPAFAMYADISLRPPSSSMKRWSSQGL